MQCKKSKILLLLLLLSILNSKAIMGRAENNVSENNISVSSISENGVTEDDIPENQVSENSVSENDIPENQVPENGVSENNIPENQVPENSVSENSISQNAIDTLYRGKCGENVTFEFDESTGTLEIRGRGFLFPYTVFGELPWSTFYHEIDKIRIGDGIKGKLWYFAKKYYKETSL